MPFEVPSSWVWCKLEEVLELISGQDFPPEKYNVKNNGIPYIIGASNIENEKLVINRWTESPSVYSYLKDLLVVCKGAGVGKMAINDIGTVHIARQIQAIRSYTDHIDTSYIKLVVKSNIENIVAKANGLIPGLKRDLLLSLQIPLPPIAEQHRVVSQINHWFTLIDNIEQGKVDLQTTIRQAKSKILNLAIHGKLVPQDPSDEPASELLKRINPKAEITCDNGQYGKVLFELPCNWSWSTLCEITEFIRNGAQIKQVKGAAGIPITRIETISNSELDLTRMGYSDIFNENEYSNYFLQEGDILMSHINSRIHVGKCALCRNMPYKIIHGMNLLRICLKKDILPEYIILFFRTNIFYTQIEPYIKNAVNQASINITNLQKTLMPIPPLPEQKRIVDAVNKAFDKLDTIMESL